MKGGVIMKKLGIMLVILPCLLASSVFAAWNFNAETSLKDSDSKTIDGETQFKDIYAISYR